VDHPPGGHDDLANAAAGALVLTAAEVALTFTPPIVWRNVDWQSHLARGYP
jgi:hypothetical protein